MPIIQKTTVRTFANPRIFARREWQVGKDHPAREVLEYVRPEEVKAIDAVAHKRFHEMREESQCLVEVAVPEHLVFDRDYEEYHWSSGPLPHGTLSELIEESAQIGVDTAACTRQIRWVVQEKAPELIDTVLQRAQRLEEPTITKLNRVKEIDLSPVGKTQIVVKLKLYVKLDFTFLTTWRIGPFSWSKSKTRVRSMQFLMN